MGSRDDPVELARALIRCKSVTPAEGGALTLLESVLRPAGFTCHRLTMTEPGYDDVENLFARMGTGKPAVDSPAVALSQAPSPAPARAPAAG